MLRIAFKNALARKGRFVLTSLAIVVGTAFLSGVLVFTGTLQRSFRELFAQAYENTDAFVRSSNVVEGQFADIRDLIPSSLMETVEAQAGVESAGPYVRAFASMSRLDNRPLVEMDGPPEFGAAFDDGPTSPWKLAAGRAPTAADEVAVDRRSATMGDVVLGQRIIVRSGGGSAEFTVVGIVTFAGADTQGGSSWALFEPARASEFILGQAGKLDAIAVHGDGSMTDVELARSLETALAADPSVSDLEVLTGAEITAQEESEIQRGLRFFTIFLSVFAMIALFVSAFVIYNVFTIAQVQRSRENALMRAIGANRNQITGMLIAESLLVGLFGSLLGFAGGIGLAAGIVRLLRSLGFGLLNTPLTISSNVPVLVVLVGTIVTMACASVPAVRAGRVPPLAALRDVTLERKAFSRGRVITGVGFLVAAVAMAWVNSRGGPVLFLGGGAVCFYIGVLVCGPLIAEPVARLALRPLRRLRGTTGVMAAENSVRNPRRTAVTAAALLIGLSLMIGISTMGASIRASVSSRIQSKLRGDYVVSSIKDAGADFGTIPTTLADQIDALPEVRAAAGLGAQFLSVESAKQPGKFEPKVLLVMKPEPFGQLVDLEFSAGGLDGFTATDVLISRRKADRDRSKLGDRVNVRLLDGSQLQLTVAGIFDLDLFSGGLIVSRDLLMRQNIPLFDSRVFVQREPEVSDAAARAAIEPLVAASGGVRLLSPDGFVDEQTGELNSFLNFTYALLGMSVFIATLGIILTLVLSIHERRRELGVLRAVGMTRGQLRTMVRWESVIIAVLGAVQGVFIGILLGWLIIRSLRDEGLETFRVSWPSVGVFIALSVTLGMIAAWWPARKASRAEILSSIGGGQA